MILVDTSVWIAHFRKGSSKLGELLNEASVMVHPFVMGELACGNLKNRARILSDLEALPSAVSATHEEVMRLIEDRKLWGLGPEEEGTSRNHVLTWSGRIRRAV
jgi:predicted nucleic acid-binding protein